MSEERIRAVEQALEEHAKADVRGTGLMIALRSEVQWLCEMAREHIRCTILPSPRVEEDVVILRRVLEHHGLDRDVAEERARNLYEAMNDGESVSGLASELPLTPHIAEQAAKSMRAVWRATRRT